jgi:peroxiredoxin Q/BCP
MLKEGEAAPSFDLPDADMEMVSLAGFKGTKNVVLYFYPKDDTPGCTLEAIDFSDLEDVFSALSPVVLGVSMDD